MGKCLSKFECSWAVSLYGILLVWSFIRSDQACRRECEKSRVDKHSLVGGGAVSTKNNNRTSILFNLQLKRRRKNNSTKIDIQCDWMRGGPFQCGRFVCGKPIVQRGLLNYFLDSGSPHLQKCAYFQFILHRIHLKAHNSNEVMTAFWPSNKIEHQCWWGTNWFSSLPCEMVAIF